MKIMDVRWCKRNWDAANVKAKMFLVKKKIFTQHKSILSTYIIIMCTYNYCSVRNVRTSQEIRIYFFIRYFLK